MGFDTTPKLDTETVEKCDEKAIEFRKLGNEKYNSKKRFDSFGILRLYNQSIAYAKSKEEVALSYANRSATYFEEKYYKECLQNIQWARENNYPADKMAKLDEREEKCKKLMEEKKDEPTNKNDDPWVVFELTRPANKKIPFIVDCVELKKTANGHGIYATKDLNPGDVISVEESIVYFLRDESYYERCFNCYKPNLLNLIPCNKTASIMFCSTECMESTYAKTLHMGKVMCDDMKLISEIAAGFGSKKEFADFAASTDLKQLKKTIFDYDLSDPKDPDYKKNLMMCVLSSVKKYDKCSHNFFCLVLDGRLNLKLAEHIIDILHSNNQLEPFLANMHQGRREIEYSRDNPCDPSIPLFAGLINRGRAGNAFSVLPGNKVVVIVMKPIKKGREVLFSNKLVFF